MSAGQQQKPPASGDGVKVNVVMGPIRASVPTVPGSTTTVPTPSLISPRPIASTVGQLRPTPSIHRPILQDASKPTFTGQPAVRSPFVGTGRAIAPAIPASSSVISPFSASAIGLSSPSSQPTITKNAVTVSHPPATVGPPVSTVTVGLTVTTSITTAAVSAAPMASIIRGGTNTHPAMQAAYSSHVPRGAAAVASITTLKSAVATPIPRSSQMYSHGFSSTATSSHPLLQPRTATPPTIRAGPPPVSRTVPQAFGTMDIHRPQTTCATAANLSSAKLLIAAPRVSGDCSIRQSNVHSTAGAIQKTQPFLQQLHQLPDKGFYRPTYTPATLLPIIHPAQVPTTTVSVKAAIGHQGLPTSGGHVIPQHPQLVAHMTTGVATTPTTVASVAATASVAAGSFISTTSPQSQIHAQYHPHLPKVITQVVHTIAPISQAPSASMIPSGTRPVFTTSVVTHSSPRPILSTGTSIPVAKVYPQPLTIAARPVVTELAQHVQDSSENVSSTPTTTLFISPSQQRHPSGVSVSGVTNITNQVVTGNVVGSVSAGVLLAEAKSDRPPVESTATFAALPSGTTTYYYEPYHGLPGTAALTMHPFPGTTAGHSFAAVSAAAIRPGLTMHGAPIRNAVPNSAPVSIGSAVIMSMNPNNRQTLSVPTTVGHTSAAVSDSSSVSTVGGAVSSIGSLVGHLMPTVPGSPVHSTGSSNQAGTPSSSPRPSILRKRAIDGASNAIRKNLMSSLPSSQPASPQRDSVTGSNVAAATTGTSSSSSSSSPNGGTKESVNDNAQAFEGNDINVNGSNSSNVVIKKEVMDAFDTLTSKTSTTLASMGTEASPRKKPRKQQLTGNEMVEIHSTEGEDGFDKDNRSVKKEVIKEDEEGVRWVSTRKRPPVAAMLNAYRHSWKSRNNHFLRYSDIKLKDERRPTIGDLANRKEVIQKVNGWKVYHICAQIEDIAELETAAHSRLSSLLENMEKKAEKSESDDIDLNRANELVRGNLQRCKIIRDQMKDARVQILKVLDHKSRIVEIVTKHASKPTGRKRERHY